MRVDSRQSSRAEAIHQSSRVAGLGVVAGILSGGVPLLLVLQVPNVGRSSAWIVTFALTAWAGARLAYRIVIGTPRLFDFIFWLFVYIFMGITPTAQMRSDELSTTTPGMYPDQDLHIAEIVWLGIILYEAGRLVHRQRANRLSPSHPNLRANPVVCASLDVAPARAIALTLVGVASSAYYISKVGVGSLFTDRYAAAAIRAEAFPDIASRSIVASLASYPLLIAAGVYLRVWLTRAYSSASGRYLPLLIPTLGTLLLVVNPVSSARYDLGTVGFALAVFVGATSTVRRARASMAGVLVAFLFIFPIADAFRGATVNTTRNGFFGEYLANPDYDAFWQIGNALRYDNDGLVQPFRQVLGVLLFWVPRGIWPTKPQDTGTLLADYRGYSFGNLSAPLWAELLVNGGPILVALGFFFLGYFLRKLDDRSSTASLGTGQLWSIIGGVFPFYMVILLRGSLLQATGTLVVAVACTLFVRTRRRPSPGM